MEIVDKIKQKFIEIAKSDPFNDSDYFSIKDVIRIIDDVVKENIVPKEIVDARKYILSCESDIGFMGSPDYFAKKKLVEEYDMEVRNRKMGAEEKEAYKRLKAKYEP